MTKCNSQKKKGICFIPDFGVTTQLNLNNNLHIIYRLPVVHCLHHLVYVCRNFDSTLVGGPMLQKIV